MKGYGRGVGVLIILILLGSIIGGWLGTFLARVFPGIDLLQHAESIGLTPTTLDLRVLTLTLGFGLKLNLLSLMGAVTGYLVYRRS